METVPADARVRVLDLGQTYRAGMELPPGEYQVEVSAEGFKTKLEQLKHAGEGSLHRVELERVCGRVSSRYGAIGGKGENDGAGHHLQARHGTAPRRIPRYDQRSWVHDGSGDNPARHVADPCTSGTPKERVSTATRRRSSEPPVA